MQKKRTSSRIEEGITWFVSSGDGKLGVPMQVPPRDQGASRVASESQVSIQVARASAGVLWIHSRGIRPQFAWKGESQGVS